MLTAIIVANSVVQIRPVGTNDPIGREKDQLVELSHPSPVVRVAFDPESKLVVTAAADGLIRQWSLPERWTGTPEEIRRRVEVHTGIALSKADRVVVAEHVADFARTFGDNEEASNNGQAQTLKQQGPRLLLSFATKFLSREETDAIRLRNEGRWKEADAALTKWASQRTNDWQPHALRMRTLVELREFDEADAAWNETARRIGRDAAFAWLKTDFDTQLAYSSVTTSTNDARYNRLDADSAAIQGWYYRRLLEFAPDNATRAAWLFQMAKVHEVEFEFDRAADAINRAVALDNDSADVHYYRAHLMERLSRWDEALESRREFWRLEPDNQDSPYRVVTALVFADRREEFLESWKRFHTESKDRLDAASDVKFSNGLIAAAATRDRLAKPRLIAGGPRDESLRTALEMADANFDDPDAMKSDIADFFRSCKGLAEYRRGQPNNLKSAVEILDTAFNGFRAPRSRFRRGAGITRFIAAMAHEKLGNHELAVTTYLQGLDHHLCDGTLLRQSTTIVANDWQLAEVARREAAELLKIDLDEIDIPVPNTDGWTVMFEDNFDDGISEDWQQMTGQWSVVDGAACGVLEFIPGGTPAYGRLEREIPDLPNTFEIEYETWTSAPMLTACFLRQPTDDRWPVGHRVALCSAPDRDLVKQDRPGKGLSLLTYPGWNSTDFWFPQANPDFQVKPEQHYNVRIVRQPQRITVFIDGNQVMSQRVRNIETKSIRFFARGEQGTKMYVDNLRIHVPAE